VGSLLTTLVATAIANTQARTDLRGVAEEQAALRRVATLVAQGAAPEQVFAAVTEEMARLLPVDLGSMARYDPDGTLTYKWDKALRDLGAIGDGLSPDQRWAAWNSLGCPVLLVRGDASDILAPETADRMVAGNPHVSLAVVPDCGHSITLDRPEGLLDAAGPWLDATEPS